MTANNLTFEQIKELAEIATKNNCDFELDISGEDINIYINQHKKSSVTTTSPYYPQIYYNYNNAPSKMHDNDFKITLT